MPVDDFVPFVISQDFKIFIPIIRSWKKRRRNCINHLIRSKSVFYLLSLHAYWDYLLGGESHRRGRSLLFFTLSMLAKPMAISLEQCDEMLYRPRLDCYLIMVVESIFRRASLTPESRISILLRSRHIVYLLYLAKLRNYSVTTQLLSYVKANSKKLRQNKQALC